MFEAVYLFRELEVILLGVLLLKGLAEIGGKLLSFHQRFAHLGSHEEFRLGRLEGLQS